jgi:hypothetical protein
MRVLGDEAEQVVAEKLALMGFNLVYQRAALPAGFRKAEWGRMEAEARRLGWRWLVAAVTPPPESEVHLLDPARVRTAPRGLLLPGTAAIANVLTWLDRKASGRR